MKKKSKVIVSCLIVLSVLLLTVGGIYAYPMMAMMVSPERHAVSALANLNVNIQEMIDGFAENPELIGVEGELEVNLDVFEEFKDLIETLDGSTNVNISFRLEGNHVYVHAPAFLEEDFSAQISLSDLRKLEDADIHNNLPQKCEQYKESCEKLDRVLHELSKIDFVRHSDILTAAAKDISKGCAVMLQNATFERLDTNTENLSDTVSYRVVILQHFAKQGIFAAIDEMYADSKVLPHISILKTAADIDQQELKDIIGRQMDFLGDIDFVVDVNEKTDTIENLYAELLRDGQEACKLTLHFV